MSSATYTYNAPAGSSTREFIGNNILTQTDLAGRVEFIRGRSPVDINVVLYQAEYAYWANRNLVKKITYLNGMVTEYDYDAAERVTAIRHRYGTNTPLLELAYTYDARGLITRIDESESGVTSSVVFEYDRRRRLTRETRTGAVAYDLQYTYDHGGNRLTKVDHLADVTTTYEYDIHAPTTYGSRNNRLMWTETRAGAGGPTDDLVERVTYDYALDGEATGNIVRVSRKVPDPAGQGPPSNPWDFDVSATEFAYNKAAEVRFISQRRWEEDGGSVSNVVTYRMH